MHLHAGISTINVKRGGGVWKIGKIRLISNEPSMKKTFNGPPVLYLVDPSEELVSFEQLVKAK